MMMLSSYLVLNATLVSAQGGLAGIARLLRETARAKAGTGRIPLPSGKKALEALRSQRRRLDSSDSSDSKDKPKEERKKKQKEAQKIAPVAPSGESDLSGYSDATMPDVNEEFYAARKIKDAPSQSWDYIASGTNIDFTLNELQSILYSVKKNGEIWKPIDINKGLRYSILTNIRNNNRGAMIQSFTEKKPLVCEIDGAEYTMIEEVPDQEWKKRYNESYRTLAMSIWQRLQEIREERDGQSKEEQENNYFDYECKRQVYTRFVALLQEERENMEKCSNNWTVLKKTLIKLVEKKELSVENLIDVVEQKQKVDQDNDNDMPKDADKLFDAVQIMRVLKDVLRKEKQRLIADEDYNSFLKVADKEFESYNSKDKVTQNAKYAGSGLSGFNQLFKDCAKLNPINDTDVPSFKKVIQQFGKTFEGDNLFKDAKFVSVDNKGPTRAMYKLFYKYGGDATNLTDIMRASVVLPSCKPVKINGVDKYPIVEMVHRINEHFKGGIKRIKDRFNKPVAGYSDILLNVEYKGIICEIQVHLKPLFNIKNGQNPNRDDKDLIVEQDGKRRKIDMHHAYELSRRFTKYFMDICYELGCYKSAPEKDVKIITDGASNQVEGTPAQ